MESPALPQTPNKTSSLFTVAIIGLVLLILIIFGGGFGWFYFKGPCGVTTVKTSETIMVDQLNQFQDAYNVANSTSRIALAGPVAELQKIQRDVDKTEVPACMATAKTELSKSMEMAINGFLAFMAQEPDTTVNNLLNASTDHLSIFNDELIRINACRPFCKSESVRSR